MAAAAGAAAGWPRAVGERDTDRRQLDRHAERLRPEPREDDAWMDSARMTPQAHSPAGGSDAGSNRATAASGKTCIYPDCDRPAVPPHPLGGPQPAFCDLEEHNALTAHQERQRREPERQEETEPRRS